MEQVWHKYLIKRLKSASTMCKPLLEMNLKEKNSQKSYVEHNLGEI